MMHARGARLLLVAGLVEVGQRHQHQPLDGHQHLRACAGMQIMFVPSGAKSGSWMLPEQSSSVHRCASGDAVRCEELPLLPVRMQAEKRRACRMLEVLGSHTSLPRPFQVFNRLRQTCAPAQLLSREGATAANLLPTGRLQWHVMFQATAHRQCSLTCIRSCS